ncbi:unnamed protein product [Mycena citricolor]|uniref:Cyclin N-terminal domain-containing protein n=1 Tax=Mycena citricolor TaxID=2018698 RepID=A0AAD2GV42_9AGAR|nr:unnamed protein product [Mycena citricolor]
MAATAPAIGFNALPRELASYTLSTHALMTPPASERGLWARSLLPSHPHLHPHSTQADQDHEGYHHQYTHTEMGMEPRTSPGSQTRHSYQGHSQLLTPPDDTSPMDSEPRYRYSTDGHRNASDYALSHPDPHRQSGVRHPTPPPPPPEPEQEPEPLAWTRDWLAQSSSARDTARVVAERTCEMICYLWFAPPKRKAAEENPEDADRDRLTGSKTNGLQLAASATFVRFVQKLLETTQVSQSVIVLALHYIHRLRVASAGDANQAQAQPGSEFRVAVAGLMMANKFLDDNTYTNATWASISLIPLSQINTMEREFLAGCAYSLYVSKKTYEDWGRLLRGLVGARASASRRGVRHTHPHAVYATPHRRTRRAPSPSPAMRRSKGDETFARERAEWAEAEMEIGSKRSAAAAFSPPSYHHSHPPSHSQRPAPTVLIPSSFGSTSALDSAAFAVTRSAGAHSYSPVEGQPSYHYPHQQHSPALGTGGVTPLEHFGSLSLQHEDDDGRKRARPVSYHLPPERDRGRSSGFTYVPPAPSTVVQYPPQYAVPSSVGPTLAVPMAQSHSHARQPSFGSGRGPVPTLAARYEYDYAAAGSGVEQDLYFYALAASPMSTVGSLQDDDHDDDGSNSSGCSDDGRSDWSDEDDVDMMTDDYRSPPPRSRSRALSDAREREEQRARELQRDRMRDETKRSRLRCVLPRQQQRQVTPVAELHPHRLFAVTHSARTSPMTAATPPRAIYADHGGHGHGQWTPPRVALPRFAELERWSCHAPRPVLPEPNSHLQHQPRRAVFANAGPPGVSGYAYAY